MGSEIDTKSRPGLEFNRHITGYAIGTQPLTEVAIIRNGKVFRTLKAEKAEIDFAIDDTDLLSTVVLETSEEKPPFAYYYLRVTQADGHIAWSSPIWVDLNAKTAGPIAMKVKKKMKEL